MSSKMNLERRNKIDFFFSHIMPILNEDAKAVHYSVQAERIVYNDKQEYEEDKKLPFALDCMSVLIQCTEGAPFFPPFNTDRWTDNMCVFALNTTGEARQEAGRLLIQYGFAQEVNYVRAIEPATCPSGTR